MSVALRDVHVSADEVVNVQWFNEISARLSSGAGGLHLTQHHPFLLGPNIFFSCLKQDRSEPSSK